ncbi:DUF4440 domain-containing protein [Erwiniaceae bacterium BAC15a-03b]|uniref:DUF4440 domain-containing protein n=1 Tax=Winslowiella arboricola TaxID=2978220 RepID=A0A9J6PXA1_9GAMM|nr:DUF4440 domain-containing protein [Winslowiella arboricola]MCU5774736.1 DUF4440 domain-containing protein [Winslowiella arboricola]MCU5780112.1 DUF4440 domain-containing protein [Winslowiella arboricola]
MNRYFKEVLDAHELIRDWLGNAETSVEVCETLLSRFSPAYTMVTPGGKLLDFTALNSFFRTQHGARAGLNIEIEDMQIVAESERGATLTYKELQQLPGQHAILRFATVVFVTDPEGHVIWRHLHETFLS